MKPRTEPKPGSLRERALGHLARREHSRAELARKLESAGFDPADIAPLLDEFEGRTWLSDRRFAESWVADHRTKDGSVKLAFELRRRGVSDEIIASVLGEQRDSELERAREVWRKKFRAAPVDAADKARQMRFLQSRGFTSDVIRRVMGNETCRSPECGE